MSDVETLLASAEGESARIYEAFSFWLQSGGKSLKRTAEQFGVRENTVRTWRNTYKWEERAMAIEQARAIQPYSKEVKVNELMGKLAITASELVTRSGMTDYEAMVAAWRDLMVRKSEGDEVMTAREFKDMISAYDIIDQIGRRVARLPVVYKQTVTSYGQGGEPLTPASGEEETISWT